MLVVQSVIAGMSRMTRAQVGIPRNGGAGCVVLHIARGERILRRILYIDCWVLLVDRGLRHRLPGFPSLDRLVVLRRVSADSGTNGHTVWFGLIAGFNQH